MHLKSVLFIVLIFCLSGQVFAKKTERIISLAPSITKNIYFLEAQDMLIGCTSFCTEALADNKEVVASAITVNIEKTISLLPDLVLVSTITSPETIEMIQKFGIEVEVFSTPQSFEGICEQFVRLGKLLGKTELADQIVSESKIKVEELIKLAQDSKPNVFFQIGAKPLFTVLPHTFMNDFITLVGGVNIANNMTKGTITRETVVTKNPDIILVVTMGIIGDEEKAKWNTFNEMNAAKHDKIFVIDAEKACTPTPVTFVETLETITSLLNQ